MQTVGVGIIARNAEKSIRECIESFLEHIDQCVVVLAGESTDKTEEIVRSMNVEVYNFDWIDDFSAARNLSFSKLNTDWLFWADADDVVFQAENLHKLIEGADRRVGAIWFPYHYAIDEFGNVSTIYERERLLRASYGWVWKNRLHETVSPLQQCKFVRSDEVIIKHVHFSGHSRNERNFKLLNIMQEEDPADKRIWLYMGHQNFAANNWADAGEWYLKFGSDEGAMAVERYQALCYGSKALREMRDKQSMEVALSAIELCPEYKDAYLEMAHAYITFGDFDKAIHFARLSEVKDLIKEPPHIIFVNPLDYTFNKYTLYAEAYWKKGDYGNALNNLAMAHDIRPTKDVEQHMGFLKEMMIRDKVDESIKVIGVNLLENKEYTKLKPLLDSVPYWWRDLPAYLELEGGVGKYTDNLKDDPQIAESEGGIMVNISNSLNPEKTLSNLDEKYKKVTVVCNFPAKDSKQIRVFSQRDMEELIMSQPGRHILNLQREPTRIFCEYDRNIPKEFSVRFFLGPGLEHWSPKTISEIGCGGSETAVSMVAKEMAMRGHQPIIYASDTQIWDGVIYRDCHHYRPDSLPSGLFISSRIPVVFMDNVKADQKWLYVHDVHCYDQLTPEVASEIDVIIALSQWHVNHLKRTYPFLKDCEVIDMDKNEKTYEDDAPTTPFYPDAEARKLPKMTIIGNGINTERFKKLNKRKPHRFIWCSSPDRGLEEVLNLWPLIRKKLPDAELKIFYGWEYFDSTLHIPEQRAFKERIKKLIRQDGVEWCGRVGQKEIALELMKSSVMLYPPHHFRETYGITFLEAQAAGVICFYRENGALGETIGNRGISLKMNLTPEEIVKKITDTLGDEKLCYNIRERARKYALQRDWSKQTDKMLQLYQELNGRTQ